MHLDEGNIQRLLHREVSGANAVALRDHALACAHCRSRVEVAAREEEALFTLLTAVDHPIPAVNAAAIARRPRSRSAGRFRWAAAAVLAAGAGGAAYAAPGSALRAWVDSITEEHAGHAVQSDRPAIAADRTAMAPSREGVALAPGSRFVIEFRASHAGNVARVTLVEGVEATVRAPVGAATYTVTETRLVVDNRSDTATFEIQLPRTAPHVEIRAGKVQVLVKAGPRISGSRAVDSAGTWHVPLGSRR